MDDTLTLRTAELRDLAAVDLLLARSYPRLLAADYPPSVMVTAVPLIARAKPALLASGRYFLVEDEIGRVLGAGGWSLHSPGAAGAGEGRSGTGHVRHVATDRDALRRGIGAAVMVRVIEQARAAGVGMLECLSTRTAVPFYASLGFRVRGPVTITLAPGIAFPAVRMVRAL
ncbi:MAG: GNAT family N-acetyltransferase [Gemmobacter sp.]